MGLWDRIKKGYTSIDRKVGGYLPGGVKPGQTSTPTTSTPTTSTPTTSTPKTSSPTSSGGSSSGSFSSGKSSGSYNPSTKTYTDPSGNKSSTIYANVPKGTPVDLTGSKTSTSSGGSSNQLGQRITPAKSTGDINKGYFGGDNPNIEERGVMTVTKAEGARLKASGEDRPYWVVESETPRDALREASFAGSTPQINRNLNSKGLYEYNIQNILAGKETYRQYNKITTDFEKDPASFEGRTGVTGTSTKEGTLYQLSPDYFNNNINTTKINADALVGAKAQFKNLPTGTRRRLTATSYGQGVSSTVLGIGEFAGTIAVNQGTAVSNEKGVFEKRSFKFGGTLGEIRNYPTTQSTVKFLDSPGGYLGQKARSPEVLGQATVIVPTVILGGASAYSNVKNLGWKTGSAETLSGISPIKIRSGIYAEAITADTTFKNVKSLKSTTDGITTRAYSGSSGSIKLTGVEKSTFANGQKVGGGYSTTNTPFIEIRGGGTSVTTGTRTTLNPYTFGSTGTGSAYKAKGNDFYTERLSPKIKGGTSKIISSKGITIYQTGQSSLTSSNLNTGYISTGGGASKTINKGVKSFVSGKATPNYKTNYVGDKTINLNTGSTAQDFIYAPTGQYKLTPKLSGKEYDLNIILNKGKSQGYTSFKGGGAGSATAYKFADPGVSSVVPIVKPVIQPTNTAILPPQPKPTQSTRQPSQFAGTGMYERTAGGLSPLQTDTKPINIQTPDTIQAQIPIIKTKSGSRSRTRQQPALIQTPIIDTVQLPKARQETRQAPNLVQVRKVRLAQPQSYAQLSPASYGGGGSSYSPYSPPVPVQIPKPFIFGGGGRSMKLANVAPRQSSTRYTPSFKALFFKIRGQAPRGRIKTGINFRPITPGFSFTRKRNIIKVRKVKL